MKCPNCSSVMVRYMGEREICLTCGYGMSVVLEALADSPFDEPPSPQIVEPISAWAVAHQKFSFKLFSEIRRLTPAQNFLISPAQLFHTLVLLSRGATRETLSRMIHTLEIAEQTLNEMDQGSRAYLSKIQESQGWTSANSIWTRKDILFQPEFLRQNAENFQVEIIHQNFADSFLLQRITSWASEKTGGKIRRMVYHPDPFELLILVSAAAYQSACPEKCTCADAGELKFTPPKGPQIQAPALVISGRLPVFQEGRFIAVRIDGPQPGLSLYLFLPNAHTDPGDLLVGMDSKQWRRWQSNFHPVKGKINLPVIHLESQVGFAAALKSMGMASAMDEVRASFEDLCPIPPMPDMYIGEVRQAALLEFPFPEGTNHKPEEDSGEFRLDFDHPFAILLADERTGAIVLTGVLQNPTG